MRPSGGKHDLDRTDAVSIECLKARLIIIDACVCSVRTVDGMAPFDDHSLPTVYGYLVDVNENDVSEKKRDGHEALIISFSFYEPIAQVYRAGHPRPPFSFASPSPLGLRARLHRVLHPILLAFV